MLLTVRSVPALAGVRLGTYRAVKLASLSATKTGCEVSFSADRAIVHRARTANFYDVTYYHNEANARAAWNRVGTTLTITCDGRYPGQNQNCVASGAAYTVSIRARNSSGASGWMDSASPSP